MSSTTIKPLGEIHTGHLGGEEIVFRDTVMSRCYLQAAHTSEHVWLDSSSDQGLCLGREEIEALITHLETWLRTGSFRFTFEKEEGE